MPANRGSGTHAWTALVAVACAVSFVVLAHNALAQGLDPCHWTKEVRINDGDVTLITPGTDYYFGVALSDTIHVMDRLWCEGSEYHWTLDEHWDPYLMWVSDYAEDYGSVNSDVDFLEWSGDHSADDTVQLDKYLVVGGPEPQGWVTSTISETVEFTYAGGSQVRNGQLPFYLEELVEGGDAPSSYNHSGISMTTHITGTTASFPVVWDWNGAMSDPAPPSYGFCHYPSLALRPSFLGITVTHELDADLTPDRDGVTNIDPAGDTPDQDGADDGVIFPSLLPQCGTATVNVVGQNNLGSDLYLNAWADWNRDGDWDDTSLCECETSEWVIQGYTVSPGPFDLDIDITPCHPVADPTEPLWARVTLSELDPLPGEPWIYGGQPYPASTACFGEGETEDYLVRPEVIPECEWEKQVYVNDELAGEWDEGPFAVVIGDLVAVNDELECNFDYEWSLLEEWDPDLLSFVAEDHISGTVELDPPTSPDSLHWRGGDPVAVPAGTSVIISKTLSLDAGFSGQSVISETVQFNPYGPITWQQPVVLESHIYWVPVALKDF
jgi:hypothetical protein